MVPFEFHAVLAPRQRWPLTVKYPLLYCTTPAKPVTIAPSPHSNGTWQDRAIDKPCAVLGRDTQKQR